MHSFTCFSSGRMKYIIYQCIHPYLNPLSIVRLFLSVGGDIFCCRDCTVMSEKDGYE
jgi:uncharacterized membrane protein